MSPVLVGIFEPGSPEWLAARANGIGGSEISVVCRTNKWTSRFNLHHRKQGTASEIEDNPQMRAGRALEEAIVREWWAANHPEFLVAGDGRHQYAHADRPWQIGAPDRLLYRHEDLVGPAQPVALLEVKTARYADEWGDEDTDEVPLAYEQQCWWNLDVFGLDRCYLVVLIAGSDYREYVIEANPAECADMRREAELFLAPDFRPDIDRDGLPADSTYGTVRELNPDIEPVDHDLDGRLARRYIAAIDAAEATAEELTLAKSLVVDAMGTARRAVWDGTTIATRQTKQGGLPYLVKGRKLPDLTTQTGEAA